MSQDLYTSEAVKQPGAADGSSNGRRRPHYSSAFEAVVDGTKLHEEGDSYAIEHSLLRQEFTRYEDNTEGYTDDDPIWGRVCLLATLLNVLVKPYKAVMGWLAFRCPFEGLRDRLKRRSYLGPWELNFLLGWVVHPLLYQVREGVMTSEALDIIDSINLVIEKPVTRGQRFITYLLNQPEGQDVRNRLWATYLVLQNELEYQWKCNTVDLPASEPPPIIRGVSLACGSAVAHIEAVTKFKSEHLDAVDKNKIYLVDLNYPSLLRAKKLAEARGLKTSRVYRCFGQVDERSADVILVQQKLGEFLRSIPNAFFDYGEIVGWYDYQESVKIVEIADLLYLKLKKRGLVISAHICPSPGQDVVEGLVGWPLLKRRTPERFYEILNSSSWEVVDLYTVHFKHKVHAIAVQRKGGWIDAWDMEFLQPMAIAA